MDYARAPFLGADQKERGLWERDWARENGDGLVSKEAFESAVSFSLKKLKKLI